MKSLLQKIIRFRNPKFKFDEAVSTSTILSLFFNQLGQFLRSFKLLFLGKLPNRLFIGRGVQFQYSSKINLGKWVKLGSYVRLSALGKQGIFIGDNCNIGDFSRLVVSTSFNNIGQFIKIGNNTGIGEFAYLGGAGGLEIGSDCSIGQYLSCHPENHNYDNPNELIRYQGINRKGIKIGNNCWIGSKVTVLDGVNIGDNCVIAAGAVVTKSFADNTVIGGVPAKALKSILKNRATETPIFPKLNLKTG